MMTAGKFWAPHTLAIILTRNRPRTLRRCVINALQSTGIADALIVLDDSDEEYVRENHLILTNITGNVTPIVHIPAVALLGMLKQYLPTSALEWTQRTAQRDIAPVRNASLVLSNCFNPRHVLLIDDDIVNFDISVTQYWITQLAQQHDSVVVGAYIGGLDERDIISRLSRGIRQACSCVSTDDPSVSIHDAFTVTAEIDGKLYETEIVSGGYLSFSFTPGILEPFPPGYNEDWLWCLSLQTERIASVFRIPQVVIHDPPLIRKPSENDILFEMRGDVAFQREVAHYRSCKGTKIFRESRSDKGCRSEQSDHDSPEIWVKELLSQIKEHKTECCAYIMNQFRDFGLELIKCMYAEGRFHLDWNHEFNLWKAQSEKNRNSFFEAVNSDLTVEIVGTFV